MYLNFRHEVDVAQFHYTSTASNYVGYYVTLLMPCEVVPGHEGQQHTTERGLKWFNYKERIMSCYKHDMQEQQVGK